MAEQDTSIRELVDKINRSEIRLPEMQRQYVWTQTQVRDLLDSLYRQYPSGSILTWRTEGQIETREFATAEQEATNEHWFELLLDGQQRLTSLVALMKGKPIQVRGRKTPIEILFNLDHPESQKEALVADEEEDSVEVDNGESVATDAGIHDGNENELLERFNNMAFVVSNPQLKKLDQWISVTEIFKNPSDLQILKKAGISPNDESRYEKCSVRLTKLRAITNYKYRVNILPSEMSYEEVTEIFVRVNSRGTRLRGSDLALAQITAKWRGSLKIFQRYETACKEKRYVVDLSIHIKNLVAFSTGQSRFRIVGSLTKERMESAWEDAKKGMDYAINFCKSNVGIEHPTLLSSPFILIVIASYGHNKNYTLTLDEEKNLKYWVLIASTKGRYSRGATESMLDQDLKIIKDGQNILQNLQRVLRSQVGTFDVLPADLVGRKSNSAYFKTMFLMFKEGRAMDWESQTQVSVNLSGTRHKLESHHIFPKSKLQERQIDSEKINDIANLAFISARTNKKINNKNPSEYINNYQAASFSQQCIPIDSQYLDDYEQFLKKRRELIAERMNRFLNHPGNT